MPLTYADIERLRKFQQRAEEQQLLISTESVHTDEPEAPSSPRILTAHATLDWVPLSDMFPSLMVPRRIIRALAHPKHLRRMLTVVPVFGSSVDSVVKNLHTKQFLLRTDAVYALLHSSVLKANVQLSEHVESINRGDVPHSAEAMEAILNFVESIATSFLMLQRTVEAYHREKLKPLPVSPDGKTILPPVARACLSIIAEEDDDLLSDEGSTAHIEDDEKALPPLPADATSDDTAIDDDGKLLPKMAGKPMPDSPVSDATELPLISPPLPSTPNVKPTNTPKGFKHKLIQRLLQLRADFASKPKPRTDAEKRPSRAVLDLDALSFAESFARSEPQDDRPYVVRQSFIYDRADPLCPEEKVDMPLPEGDEVAIRLDSNGDVKAASLPALVQLLTSHHVIPLDEICETLFLFFRLFSSARKLFAALRARWDQRAPDTGVELTAQQQRVWANHICYIRNCLAQLILTWLDEYWRPTTDGSILAQLRVFVQRRFKNAGLVQGFTALVIDALDRAAHKENVSRAQRAREIERQGAPPDASPLQLVLRPEDDYCMNLAVFESTLGRERFAAQITALAHKHFRALDPEVAVARWVTSEPTFFQIQKLEEALLMWVAQSIVELRAREDRVTMIEFWLDVASICVNLRNFSSGSAIFGGLVLSPVERLSLTILEVGISSKEQYRQLNRLFDGTNNYALYRRTLAANNLPAVPLILVLRKDVISTTEISGPVALTNDPDGPKNLINFSAYRMLKKTICTMEACLVRYDIQAVGMIQDWIDKQLALIPREEYDALRERLETMRHAWLFSRSRETRGARAPSYKKRPDLAADDDGLGRNWQIHVARAT
ncbi:ras guanine nucleotide exchange factor domain-containing protein [Mycena vitilis]|nr:ras guanine nucleotide exchange factor domain-containing protein [Mycena vitilis]